MCEERQICGTAAIVNADGRPGDVWNNVFMRRVLRCQSAAPHKKRPACGILDSLAAHTPPGL
jgi:hypothetical protein